LNFHADKLGRRGKIRPLKSSPNSRKMHCENVTFLDVDCRAKDHANCL